ncbi:MAG: murein hydrolase activator EnvC family protein [Acidimicrobiia bacterium]
MATKHPIRLTIATLAGLVALAFPSAASAQVNAAAGTTPATSAKPSSSAPPTTTPAPPAPTPGGGNDDTVDIPTTPPDPNAPVPVPVPDSGGPRAQDSASINAQAKLDYSKFADAAKQVQERTKAAAEAAERYESLVAKKAVLDQDIDGISRQVAMQQRGIDALRDEVRERAALLYIGTGQGSSTPSTDTNDVLAAMRSQKLASSVAEQDRNRSNDLQRRVDRLARINKDLQKKQADATKAEEEAKKAKDEVDAALAVAQLFLTQTKAELKIVSADGKVCPIAGPVTFTNDWGMPRSGGRTHKGTDLINPYGTPNVAIVPGYVSFDVDGLGGNGAHLKGIDGNTYYYAHLSRWEGVPRFVNQGEVLGYTGDSGNARGGIPHTHFQLHPGGGAPANPYPTLAPLCGIGTGAEGPDPNYRPPNG